MRSVRRLVFTLFTLALVCALGPFALERLGFTFLAMDLGGVGDHVAGFNLPGAVMRLDLFLMLGGTLGLILVLLFRRRGAGDRTTELLAISLAASSIVAAIQVIDLPTGGLSADLFRHRVHQAGQISLFFAGLVLLSGCLAVSWRDRAPTGILAGLIVLLGAVSLAVTLVWTRGKLPAPWLMTVSHLLLMAGYLACAWLLRSELRRQPAPAYVAAVVAGLLPMLTNQAACLVPGFAPEAVVLNRAVMLLWCAYLIPVIGLSVDLAREAARDAQAQEQAYLRRIIDAVPDLIFVRDTSGQFPLQNRAAATVLGDTDDALAAGALHDQGAWVVGADGQRRFLQAHTQPLPAADGASVQELGVARDVTRLKLAEEQLEQRLQSERTLRRCLTRLVRSPAAGFNTAMRDVLSEVGAYCRADSAFVFEQDHDTGTVRCVSGWREPGAPKRLRLRMDDVDWALPILGVGEIVVYADPEHLPGDPRAIALGRRLGLRYLMLAPIVGCNGQLWGAIGVHCPQPPPDGGEGFWRVLTSLADLYAVVRERGLTEEALQEAKEAAEASNRAKSEFLANMSHEIRTPLNAVIGIADILRGLEPTVEQTRYLMMIDQAGQSLLALIEDILDISRIEAGRLVLDPVPVDLPDLIAETMTMVACHARQNDLELRTHLDTSARVRVQVDPLRLRQVLLNLLGNAIKFTERGHVSLSVTHHDGVCTLVVADTGIGIAADQLPRLCDKFTQADNSHTRRFGGSGLGLAISSNLVRMMGGTLSLASEEGAGTTVTVTVPLAAEPLPDTADGADGADATAAPAAPADVDNGADQLAGARVLLVEDNLINQKVASSLLESMGCVLTLAQNGEEAVAAAARQVFDVVMMDCQMPVMDGLEATRRIRALDGDGAMAPIVAMTANVTADHRRACLAAGMDDFVSKPVRKQLLQQIVLKWLRSGRPAPVS
jgi:CheY-like chemotaxis protein/PAS domain-containing protein